MLDGHPWFEVVRLCASERSAGKPYAEAVTWVQSGPLPERLAGLVVEPCAPTVDPDECPLVFSALDTRTAGELERGLASGGALVVTNAGAHRMDSDVPLVVPEVNPDHLDLLAPGEGGIIANPNCSTIGLVLALAPLERALGVARVHVVSLQAVSGAGHPGISSLEMVDNVVPFIPGEAEKLETEPRKILGELTAGGIRERDFTIGARCNRVPVLDGHVLCVSVELSRPADESQLRQLWASFAGVPQELGLPAAPEHPVVFLDPPAVPQPRLHRETGAGMSVVVGGTGALSHPRLALRRPLAQHGARRRGGSAPGGRAGIREGRGPARPLPLELTGVGAQRVAPGRKSKQAISAALRTSRRPSARAGTFQVVPSRTGRRTSSS